jgi:hypothetical protein
MKKQPQDKGAEGDNGEGAKRIVEGQEQRLTINQAAEQHSGVYGWR